MRIKRAMALLLAVLMMASLLAVGVSAADELTVITKSNGRRTLTVGSTFTYSFALKLQRPYSIDSIEANILYDSACLELVDYTYPNFQGAVPDSVHNAGDLHFKKGLITNHDAFSQSILDVVVCTFRVKRGGTTYLRPVIAQLEAEAGSNSDAYLVQNYRPSAAGLAFWKSYDYLDSNKPTGSSSSLNANEDTVWFYVTDETTGTLLPEGVKFILEGADEGGTARSYSAKTDSYGFLCFPKVRFGSYHIRCDSTNLSDTTYLVNDPEVNVPNVSGSKLIIDTELSVRSVQASELQEVTVTFTWTGEELEPGVTYKEDRPDTVYFALRAGETVLAQKYAAHDAATVVFERIPIAYEDVMELAPGAIDQYDPVITKDGNHFTVEFRYKNEHTWHSERKEPTCTENGSVIFTCSDCGKTYTETLAALGHDYEVYGYDATCTRDGYHRYQCKRCGHLYIKTEPKTGHNWGEWIVDKRVTATEDGLRHRFCMNPGCDAREDQIWACPEHEHSYREVVVEPTCTEAGYTKRACGCGVEEVIPGTEVRPLGHDYSGDSHTVNVVPATCTEDGLEEWTCSRCGEIIAVPIQKTGHNYQVKEQQEPTCTEPGYKEMECANCGDHRSQRIPALGHSWGEWETVVPATTTAPGSKRHVCQRCGAEEYGTIPKLDHVHDYTLSEVIAPTCEKEGYTKRICPDDGASIIDETSYVPALGHIWKERWRQSPTNHTQGVIDYVCDRCGKHNFVTIPIGGPEPPAPDPNPTVGGFTDVSTDAFYATPVLWAVNHDPRIANGTSATTFSPDETCTRAQAVTFLWRAMDCPEPDTSVNPFTDVSASDWYYKPVLWAAENNITAGIGGGKFDPNGACNRAQIVTFLWRAEGQPEPQSTVNPFSDVSASDWYYQPVLWAAENGITSGYPDGRFGPNDSCTRGQIVTFLYRSEHK